MSLRRIFTFFEGRGVDGGDGDHSLVISVGSVSGRLREANERMFLSVWANSSRSFVSRSFCNRRTAMVSSLIADCMMALEMSRRFELVGVLKGSFIFAFFV